MVVAAEEDAEEDAAGAVSIVMKDHIILCGLGHIGYRITELLLRLSEDPVIITYKTRDEWKDKIELSGIKVIIGDASDDRKLIEAGIKTARIIIAATDDDLINVTIALDAKRLNPQINVVIRLFDQTLARTFEQNLNVRRVLSTSLLSAPEFAAASMGDKVFGSFEINDRRFMIERLKVDDEILKKYKTIKELQEKENIVVADKINIKNTRKTLSDENPLSQDDDFIVLNSTSSMFSSPIISFQKEKLKIKIPDLLSSFFKTFTKSTWFIFMVLFLIVIISTTLFSNALQLDLASAFYYVITTITTVGYGDINLLNASPLIKLYGCFLMLCGAAFITALFGTVTNFFIKERLELFFGKHSVAEAGHIVVVGSGNISYRVVKELLLAGQNVVLISQDEKDESVQAIRDLCPVVLGSVRSKDVLIKANFSKARALISILEDDVMNLSVGLSAKEINPDARVVLRAFNSDLAVKARGFFKIDSILSISLVAAPSFVGASLYPDVKNSVVIDDNFFLFHHTVIYDDSKWLYKPLKALENEENIKILLIKKQNADFSNTNEDQIIQKEDEIIYLRVINLKNSELTG